MFETVVQVRGNMKRFAIITILGVIGIKLALSAVGSFIDETKSDIETRQARVVAGR